MTELTITKTLFIKAPAAHVWKFLTEADQLALWFHRGAENLQASGRWSMLSNSPGKEGTEIMWGQVLEYSPPHRLVHTFTHNWIEGAETTCRWTLDEVEGGTVVTLVHAGWEAVADAAFNKAADHEKGWDEHFQRLRHVAA